MLVNNGFITFLKLTYDNVSFPVFRLWNLIPLFQDSGICLPGVRVIRNMHPHFFPCLKRGFILADLYIFIFQQYLLFFLIISILFLFIGIQKEPSRDLAGKGCLRVIRDFHQIKGQGA